MSKIRNDATRDTERRWRETHRRSPAYKAKKAREKQRYHDDPIYREQVRERYKKYKHRAEIFIVTIATTDWRDIDGILTRYHGDLSQFTEGASVDA